MNTTITPASLSLFFPPPYVLTPTAQPTIERVKEEVKALEEYICVNFEEITDELASNERMTLAVKAFVSFFIYYLFTYIFLHTTYRSCRIS